MNSHSTLITTLKTVGFNKLHNELLMAASLHWNRYKKNIEQQKALCLARDVNISVFQDDHLEKKSIRQTTFLGVLGLYIHPLKDRLPQTSVEGCPEDLFI